MKKRTYIKDGKTITVKHRVSSLHKGQTPPKDQKWLEFIHMQGFFKVGETAMPIPAILDGEQVSQIVDMYIGQLINQENAKDTETDQATAEEASA